MAFERLKRALSGGQSDAERAALEAEGLSAEVQRSPGPPIEDQLALGGIHDVAQTEWLRQGSKQS